MFSFFSLEGPSLEGRGVWRGEECGDWIGWCGVVWSGSGLVRMSEFLENFDEIEIYCWQLIQNNSN